MPFKNRYAPGSPIVLAPWIFIIIVAIFAYYAINRIDRQTFRDVNENSQEYISASGLKQCFDAIPANSPLTADNVKSCFQSAKSTSQVFDETVKPRIEELKWLLTIIATIGGFFAIAQGAATWFSAQVYTKQAEEGLKAISDVHDAIKARYPLFDHVEAMRKDVIVALNNVFTSASKAPDSWAGNTEALDWKDNLFRKLGVEARQRLLSVESFASIDLDPSFASDDYADILRKFSLFYRAKFLYEDRVGQGSFGDLERAEAYLIFASRKKADFTIKNDLGSLYGTVYASVIKDNPSNKDDANFYLHQAETAFRESLIIEPNQQRAHYSLAVIAGAHRKRYEDAISELQMALKSTVWQREPSDYMKSMMFYNMACYHSQLLQRNWDTKTPVTSDQAKTVVEFLEKAADLSSVRRDIIDTDFNELRGDFTGLLKIADPGLQTRLANIRIALEKKVAQLKSVDRNANTPADLTVSQAITRAIRLIRTAFRKHKA